MNMENCNALKQITINGPIWHASLASEIGDGGGLFYSVMTHTVKNISNNETDIVNGFTIGVTSHDNCQPDLHRNPTYLQPFVSVILQHFKQIHSHVVINNYYIENSVYIMNHVPFNCLINNGDCDYTIMCYYVIGSGIQGGNLTLYDSEENLTSMHVPVVGKIEIFSGNHSFSKMSATPQSTLIGENCIYVLSVHINVSH